MNPFAKKPTLLDYTQCEPKDYLRVIEIVGRTESDGLPMSLGVTEERSKWIQDECWKHVRAHQKDEGDGNTSCSPLDTIIYMSQHCKHANELCLVSVTVSAIVDKLKNPLGGLLAAIVAHAKGGKDDK